MADEITVEATSSIAIDTSKVQAVYDFVQGMTDTPREGFPVTLLALLLMMAHRTPRPSRQAMADAVHKTIMTAQFQESAPVQQGERPN